MMTLDDELNRLLSFYTSSPQFTFYRDNLESKLSKDLYDKKITKETYNEFMDKIYRKVDEECLHDVTKVFYLLSKYNPTVETHDFYSLNYFSGIKYLSIISSQIAEKIAPLADNSFMKDSSIYNFLVSILKKIEECIDNPSRIVYKYVNEFEYALSAFLKDSRITPNVRKCVYVFYDIKEIILKQDKKFYDEVFYKLINSNSVIEKTNVLNFDEDGACKITREETLKSSVNRVIYNSNDKASSEIKESSVFSNIKSNEESVDYEFKSKVDEGLINSYYDLMVATTRFYRECFGSYVDKKWPSKKIYNLILKMDCSNNVKDYFTSLFTYYRSLVIVDNLDYKRVFETYITYGEFDFLFLSSKQEFTECYKVCQDIIRLTSLKSMISYAIGRANLEYLASGDEHLRNLTLGSVLLKFSNAGMLNNTNEVYGEILRQLNWEV